MENALKVLVQLLNVANLAIDLIKAFLSAYTNFMDDFTEKFYESYNSLTT